MKEEVYIHYERNGIFFVFCIKKDGFVCLRFWKRLCWCVSVFPGR